MSVDRLLIVRQLPLCPYEPVWLAMRAYTDRRGAADPDEIWLLEHPPVYTQGLAGRAEHLLQPGAIPVVQSDRGGQITYHGPGQLICYVLLDLRRLGLSIRALVSTLEEAVIGLAAEYGLRAASRPDAPGVYVAGRKLASLGLRVRRGCTYHGLALNVSVDLGPFDGIDPCGYRGLTMTRLHDLGVPVQCHECAVPLLRHLVDRLGYTQIIRGELPTLPPHQEPPPDG